MVSPAPLSPQNITAVESSPFTLSCLGQGIDSGLIVGYWVNNNACYGYTSPLSNGYFSPPGTVAFSKLAALQPLVGSNNGTLTLYHQANGTFFQESSLDAAESIWTTTLVDVATLSQRSPWATVHPTLKR